MRFRKAFTLLELVFVIVIMGIIGKFGVEFLARSYESFIFSNINNTLQSQSATAVEFIASRLQYRIKDSVIGKKADDSFDAIGSIDPTTATNYIALEWVSTDIENFRGTLSPNWSGITDLDASNVNIIDSPETNTTAIDNLIQILSYGNSTVDDAALYFVGSNNDISTYGWDGVAIADHNQSVMHPINDVALQPTQFQTGIGGVNFSRMDMYEYYKLAWTANAIVLEDINALTKTGDLVFYYNYQPWNGEEYSDLGQNIQSFTLMEDVSTFQFMAIGAIIKIQVCVKSNLVSEEYSLCKEKTIF